MSKIINCSFIMDVSEFASIDFYFGESIDGIEENYDITKHYPTTGKLTHGDIQLELTNEEFENLSENFFIEAKLNMTNEEGSIKAFTHKIKKEQTLLGASLVVDSNTTTTVTFYLGENSFCQYDYEQSFNKPSVNNITLEGNKTSKELGLEQGNWFYVDEYKANKTYPVKDNKIFAGWFTDETLTTVYTEETGLAYAYFVNKACFDMKAQLGDGIIRFLCTISNAMKDSVDTFSFMLNGIIGTDTIVDKIRNINHIYTTIVVDGVSVTPQDVGYPLESKYFTPYTINGLDFTSQPIVFTAYPQYTTQDGTTVILEEKANLFQITEEGELINLPKELHKYILSQYKQEVTE